MVSCVGYSTSCSWQVGLYQPGQTGEPVVSRGRGVDQEDPAGGEDGSQRDT